MSPRPKAEVPLVRKIAQAFKAVGKLQRAGTNKLRRYKYTRATDVLEAVRMELLNREVLIHISEDKPEYMLNVATTNGGEQLNECRLPVTYTFMDEKGALQPMKFNGIGRDVEDKALYKAQTGAQKALLKRFGLMAEEADDPEWDESHETGESLDDVAPMRVPNSQKPVTPSQIRAFQDACANTSKSADEISGYLLTAHKVSTIAELKRGRPFTDAIRWASNGAGTLAPKPQAAPALQGSLPLPRTAPSFEMSVGGKRLEVQPKTGSYAL